jgi:hypothetical protein
MNSTESHTDRGEFEAAVAERTWETFDPRWGMLTRAVELAEMVDEAPEAASTRTASVWRAELLIRRLGGRSISWAAPADVLERRQAA